MQLYQDQYSATKEIFKETQAQLKDNLHMRRIIL